MDYPKAIDEVWLFGSQARGDAKKTSDTDVLVVSDLESIDNFYPQLHEEFGQHADIAHYTWEGISVIVDHGSLFGMHLKYEGKPLFQRTGRLQKQLAAMPAYAQHTQDLRLLGELLADIECQSPSLTFESGLLATAFRNTAIILTHFLGSPDFSTQAPYTLAKLDPALALPISKTNYELLQQCRRMGERGLPVDRRKLSSKKLSELYSAAKLWHAKCAAIVQRQGS